MNGRVKPLSDEMLNQLPPMAMSIRAFMEKEREHAIREAWRQLEWMSPEYDIPHNPEM